VGRIRLKKVPKLDLKGIGRVVFGGKLIGKRAGLSFIFKYWPSKTANSKPALLEGEIWAEYPKSLLAI
jgi:hypothetical protein